MAIYRREFLKAGAALVAAAAAQQSRVALAGPDLKQSADDVLQTGVDSGDVPGVVAMATTPRRDDLRRRIRRARARPEHGDEPDTVVWIASMTKALTGAAAMQLVEQGRLDLDSPATPLGARNSAALRVLDGWEANGKPRMRAPKRPITLRHLLTHTAGFAYESGMPTCARYQKAKDLPRIGSCKNVALRMPLMFDPGERWEYGINIDWAGKMVEAVSGKRLGEYLQQNLFGPLGMDSTAFKITPGHARAHGEGPSARRRRQARRRAISRCRRSRSSRWAAAACTRRRAIT